MNVIGVNVREVEGRARPIVAPADTGRAAFLIRSMRGPAHRPVTVNGAAEFARVFGPQDAATQGAAVVESFFDNDGAEVICVRVTSDTATAARQTLNDRSGAPTLRVEAGWHGAPAPGSWADTLEITTEDNSLGVSDVPAQVIGGAAPFALSDGDQLDIAIDGAASVPVVFQTAEFDRIGQATAEEVAAVIRQAVPALRTAAVTGGRVLIAGRQAGLARRLELSGAAATSLGFLGAAANSDGGLEGVDVVSLRGTAGFGPGQALRVSTQGRVTGTAPLGATTAIPDGASFDITVDGGAPQTITFTGGSRILDLSAAPPAEIVAEINRQSRGFAAALDQSGALVLASVSVGPASTVALAAGATDGLTPLSLNGAAPVAGTGVVSVIAERSDSDGWIGLTAAIPGGTALPHGATRIETAEIDVAVRLGGVEVERFASVGMQPASSVYAVDVLNDVFSGSNFIRLIDLGSASGPALDVPALVQNSTMTTPGTDPAPDDGDYAGNVAARTGLHALDTEDFELLAYSDTTNLAPAQEAIAYCASRGVSVAVMTGPPDADLPTMIDFAAPLRADVSYGAAIWPHLLVQNRSAGASGLRTIPPVGAYCGMLARVGREDGVWASPAGNRATIVSSGLVPGTDVTDVAHTDAATRGGVSVIRAIPGRGILADAARNLSANPALRLVSQRRLTNFIKASLGRSLKSFLQEPISPRLFARVSDSIGAFMSGLWRSGAFGTEEREDGFIVICDESNNPETQTQLGILTAEVRFRTPSSAEFVIVEVSQSPAETVANETL